MPDAHYKFLSNADPVAFENDLNAAIDDGYRVVELVTQTATGSITWTATLIEQNPAPPPESGIGEKLDQVIALLTRLTDRMVGP